MTISEYIKELQFDEFQIYFREYNFKDLTTVDKSNKSELLQISSNTIIDNSILTSQGQINENFKLVASSKNIIEIKQLSEPINSRLYPYTKNSLYDISIVFQLENQIIGGINIDIRNRLARSIEDDILYISFGVSEKLIELFKKYNCPTVKNHLDTSMPIYNHWRNYSYPSQLFYNPVFCVFESRISSGIMCVNYINVQLEIDPVDDKITPNQIQRIGNVERNKSSINTYLKEKFWKAYLLSKEDYELPELKDIEQLFYFVKLKHFVVPQNDDEPITLYFSTWDDEHGQTVYFYNENNIEFE